MGTVRRLATAAGDVTLGQAADACLGTRHGAEQASTRRTYGRILRRAVTEFGNDAAPGTNPEWFAAWSPHGGSAGHRRRGTSPPRWVTEVGLVHLDDEPEQG